ncbi:MAG: peptidyl-prolyl cis-trans isomerase [Proteobacteria bacterium]|nr:peptidyl-prolyl cis-trans isomerase [Pseudomonadota bacterium]
MIYRLLVFFLLLCQPLLAQAADSATQPNKGNIIMETTMGTIKIALFDDKAPITCSNFRRYVNEGFFNGLIFHRVIPGFVVQGGGFEPGLKQKKTHEPIVNEADNGLKNSRGTLSMARTQDIYSATSQFFINVADNQSLDHRGKSQSSFGYAVFAKVVDGMDVVDKIVATPTGKVGFYTDVPKADVVMLKVYEEK